MATAKESTPQGVCASQTKVKVWTFIFKFPRHWEGQTKEGFLFSVLEGALT